MSSDSTSTRKGHITFIWAAWPMLTQSQQEALYDLTLDFELENIEARSVARRKPFVRALRLAVANPNIRRTDSRGTLKIVLRNPRKPIIITRPTTDEKGAA